MMGAKEEGEESAFSIRIFGLFGANFCTEQDNNTRYKVKFYLNQNWYHFGGLNISIGMS